MRWIEWPKRADKRLEIAEDWWNTARSSRAAIADLQQRLEHEVSALRVKMREQEKEKDGREETEVDRSADHEYSTLSWACTQLGRLLALVPAEGPLPSGFHV